MVFLMLLLSRRTSNLSVFAGVRSHPHHVSNARIASNNCGLPPSSIRSSLVLLDSEPEDYAGVFFLCCCRCQRSCPAGRWISRKASFRKGDASGCRARPCSSRPRSATSGCAVRSPHRRPPCWGSGQHEPESSFTCYLLVQLWGRVHYSSDIEVAFWPFSTLEPYK